MAILHRLCAMLWLLMTSVAAIEINLDDADSVKNASAIVAKKLISYYSDTPGHIVSNIPGLLPAPFYWWEAGGMFGTLIDYWQLTGDTSYNAMVTEALLFQVGPHNDYMPPNETLSLGNDDQSFWAFAALSAAETNFPNPPLTTDPSWLSLAQAVFNEQIGRWDTSTCAGGLHWQIFPANAGFPLKNSISNGCLLQIAARLARYTGDPDGTYAPWTSKIWDWMVHVGLIDSNWNVYDNAEAVVLNCTQIDRHQWIYNSANLMVAAATMYNFTQDETWKNRTQGLLNTFIFDYFPNGIMKDICEQYNACNNDEKSFKAYASRWLATTTQLAPFTYDQIMPYLRSSAIAAAKQCSGGADGTTCGLKWFMNATYDGTDGPGQQMSAMEIFLSTLVKNQPPPLTNFTGGTSVGNPNAGYNSSDVPAGTFREIRTADKAGAGILTAVIIFGCLLGCWFLNTSILEGGGAGPKSRERRRLTRLSRATEKDTSSEGETFRLSRGSLGVLPTIQEKPVPIHLGGTQST